MMEMRGSSPRMTPHSKFVIAGLDPAISPVVALNLLRREIPPRKIRLGIHFGEQGLPHWPPYYPPALNLRLISMHGPQTVPLVRMFGKELLQNHT